jgi:hypothetical protein
MLTTVDKSPAGLLLPVFWAASGAFGMVLAWRYASQPKDAPPAKLKSEDANGAVPLRPSL